MAVTSKAMQIIIEKDVHEPGTHVSGQKRLSVASRI